MKIKYSNREPRPEDLDQIRQWKNIASEQEVRIKEIMVSKLYWIILLTLILCIQAEKRFYQLELVNREQNYNKIFNANPIIGVLDPLQAKVCLIFNPFYHKYVIQNLHRKNLLPKMMFLHDILVHLLLYLHCSQIHLYTDPWVLH